MAVVLSFTGCGQDTKIYKLDISKNGKIGLEDLVEIHKKYSKYDILSGAEAKKSLQKHYNYNGELTKEALDNAYRLSFYIDLHTENKSIDGVVLLPCEITSLKYDNFEKYPAHDGVASIRYPDHKAYTYGAHFSIEELEKLDYISKDKNQQRDLCLFVKYTSEDMSTRYKVSSNKLIYTAKEINEIMDEYEGLR